MSERGNIYVGRDLKNLETAPDFGQVTKVILRTGEDSTVEYSTGEAGLTLEADCPFAAGQEDSGVAVNVARRVLESLRGFTYKPYIGDGTTIEPAADLGDAITTNGFYGGIYREERSFGHKSFTDIAAPTSGEMLHEFQHKSATDRQFTRRVRQVSAQLGLKMDKVYSQVIDEEQGKSFGWELSESDMVWKANGATVMELNEEGLKISGTLNARAVITGELNVGGSNISASTLYSGAYSGYDWGTGGGSYGGYASKGLYSLSGSGFGFNYNTATYVYSDGPQYFTCGTIGVRGTGTYYYFSKGISLTVNGHNYMVLGYEY